MKFISPAQKNVLAILGKPHTSDEPYRLLKYCAQVPVEEGTLLFNLLTRELLLLDEAEASDPLKLDYLKEHWFVVPASCNDKEKVETVRWILKNMAPKSKNIIGYTILPTTDCNARCFYCFEHGRKRISMNEETAVKTAQYIKNHCGNEKIRITWFGGEPLCNIPAMDTICQQLRCDGIRYDSRMATNGYLLDDEAVMKAIELWNTYNVQITLDGTEEIYNKTKAYIYREGSPYQVVLDNIQRLLDAKISVQIRLNLDLYNSADLHCLVDELGQRFGGQKGIIIYVQHIFDDHYKMSELHSDDEWAQRYETMYQLEKRIEHWRLAPKVGIKKTMKLVQCIADSDNAVRITPSGHISLCDRHAEDSIIGHIEQDGFDEQVVASWKELADEIPECGNCFYYPSCYRLRKCNGYNSCYRQMREQLWMQTQKEMLGEYKGWLSCSQAEEEEFQPC